MVPVSQVILEQAFSKPVNKVLKILGDVTHSHTVL